MKRYTIGIFFICISFSLTGQHYNGVFSIENTVFRVSDDSLRIELQLQVQSQPVERGKGVRFIPAVCAEDSILYLPDIIVEGRNKKEVKERWRHLRSHKEPHESPVVSFISHTQTDTTYLYNVVTPYHSWMDSARFVLYQELVGYNDRRGLIALHLSPVIGQEEKEPYQVTPHLTWIIPEREEKKWKRQGRAYLNFQVGRSVILPDFRNNPDELSKVNGVIEDLKKNPDAEITGLFIEGYASPEGSYATNERLSRERSIALKEYLRKRFDFPEELFRVHYIAEDWAGVVQAVEESEMDYKTEVLRLIETTDIFDGRETALMKLAGGHVWKRMVKEIFPALRRVEYQIDYTVRDYTLEESTLLVIRNPESLSLRELFLLAESQGKGTEEYDRICLEIIPRYYPDHPVACHNTAARLIELGEYATAMRFIEKAGDTPATLNNKGVLLMLSGNTGEAGELFQQAIEAGVPEAEGNMKELLLLQKQ